MTEATRQLQRVRDIENDWHAKLAHDRKRTHVDDEIVIAKTHAAFSQHQSLATFGLGLFDDVSRILRRQELAFLDIDGAARARGRQNQISLSTKKRRNL